MEDIVSSIVPKHILLMCAEEKLSNASAIDLREYYSGFMTREPRNQKDKLMMKLIHGGKYVFRGLGDINATMEDAVETIIKYSEELNLHPDLVDVVFKIYLSVFKKRTIDQSYTMIVSNLNRYGFTQDHYFGLSNSPFLDDNMEFTDETYGNFLAACRFGNLETIYQIFEVTKGVQGFWEENSWNEGMHLACGCNSIYGLGLLESDMWLRSNSSNLSLWVKDYSSVCTNNNMKVIELMISKGAKDFNRGLIIASAASNLNSAQLMITHGANDFDRALKVSSTVEMANFLAHNKLAFPVIQNEIKLYNTKPRMYKNPPKPYELLFLSDKSKYYSEFKNRDFDTFSTLDREIMELLRNGLMNISARGIDKTTQEALEVIVKYHKELEVHPNVVQEYKDDLKMVKKLDKS